MVCVGAWVARRQCSGEEAEGLCWASRVTMRVRLLSRSPDPCAWHGMERKRARARRRACVFTVDPSYPRSLTTAGRSRAVARPGTGSSPAAAVSTCWPAVAGDAAFGRWICWLRPRACREACKDCDLCPLCQYQTLFSIAYDCKGMSAPCSVIYSAITGNGEARICYILLF